MAHARRIEGLVVHRCESGATGTEVKIAEAKHGLGYHFFIRRDGTVDQMYDEQTIVWHARHWSATTIAIAVHGDFVPEDKSRYSRPTDPQLQALIELLTVLSVRYNNPWIKGHTDLTNASFDPAKVCPGRNLPLAWLRARVLHNLTKRFPKTCTPPLS